MQKVTTIGLDIAKSVFQVHGVDAAGQVVIRRQLKTSLCRCVFPEAAALSRRYRSVRLIALLVTRAVVAWPYRTPHAAGLCETLRQAAEERYGGC
jgi:transposase